DTNPPSSTTIDQLAFVIITDITNLNGTLAIVGTDHDHTVGLEPIPAADIPFLQFTPTTNLNSPATTFSFKFRLQDNGSLSGFQPSNLETTDHSIAFTVNSVNDAPLGPGSTVATPEDKVLTINPSAFAFSDPSDTPPNKFKTLTIQSLPTTGTLK